MKLSAVLAVALIVLGASGADLFPADSPFGVCNPWPGMKDAGIAWNRGGAGSTGLVNWAEQQLAPGEINWEHADSEAYGIQSEERQNVLSILGYTPKWLSSGPDGDPSYPPKTLRPFFDFTYACADRYRHRIQCWEVWNEPNIGFFNGTIRQYTEMLKTAYCAAKQANPECKIVFGGTAGVDVPFIERCYEFGAGPYFDVMAVHPYQWGDTFNDGWFISKLENLRKLMLDRNDGRPIWLTELGWESHGDPESEQIQARLLVQCFTTALTLKYMGVEKIFWYCIKDWGGPGYGLLREDGSRKPAFFAYKTMTNHLAGADYAGKLDLGESVRCYVFRRKKRLPGIVAVLFSIDKQEHELTLDVGSRRVAIFDLMDKRQVVDSSGGRLHMTCRPDPVFLEGLGEGVLATAELPPPVLMPKRRPYWEQEPYLKDVWLSVIPQEGTERPYVIRHRPEEFEVVVHNDLRREVAGEITATGPSDMKVFRSLGPGTSKLKPGASVRLRLVATEPATMRPGLHPYSFTGWVRVAGGADRRPICPVRIPVRIADGRVVEFLANSYTERQYLVNEGQSGCSESCRFGARWTYKFDLPDAKAADVQMFVGAHKARYWAVQASRDGEKFDIILEGASNRDWHTASLDDYVPGVVYLQFSGDDVQLNELVLSTTE